VQNFDNIFDIIIPHFINYPLYNIKTLDFNDFKKAANLFKVGGRDNTDKIAKLIANMNSRRTSKSDDSDSKK
jgi:hypothetical protein